MPYKDPEKRKAYKKAYYEANREKAKAQTKAYYQANKERMKAAFRAWKKTNPDKVREQTHKRRALKYKTQIEPINEKIVYLRDGWICQHCKKRVDKKFKHPNPMSASLDHIIPLSKGGTHTYDNVQLAHLGCNSSKCNNVLPQGEQLRLC